MLGGRFVGLKILFIIAIILTTMIITVYIVLRNQLNTKINKVETEQNELNCLFQKRQEKIQNFMKGYRYLFDSDSAMRKTADGVLESLKNINNETNINNVFLYNKSLDDVMTDFLHNSANLKNKIQDEEFINYINALYYVQNDIETKIEMYNYAVRIYNITITIFPAKYVAKAMHLTQVSQY